MSTGLADLDLVLGGGLPLGCLLLLLEFEGTGLHQPFLQYFLAQGVASGQDTLWLQPGLPGLCTTLSKLATDQSTSKVRPTGSTLALHPEQWPNKGLSIKFQLKLPSHINNFKLARCNRCPDQAPNPHLACG